MRIMAFLVLCAGACCPNFCSGAEATEVACRDLQSSVPAVRRHAAIALGNCGQGMEIGYDTGNSPVEIVDHFQGIIDEVKVYNTALAAEEIARQFQEQQ